METLEIINWVNTLIAIAGTVANVKKLRICFLLWTISNSVFVVYNVVNGHWHQAVLFTLYTGLAVWGLFAWRCSTDGERDGEEEEKEAGDRPQ